jgi:allantoate deiminase
MDGATVMRWAAELGEISEQEGALTRTYGSPALQRAGELVASWMRESGMSVRRDAIGNLIGRREGLGPQRLLLGSHLDTVRDAGRYDGALGVLVGLACARRLELRGERLPYTLELLGFADEEGVRFGTTYLGSSVAAGRFDPGLLSACDEHGVSLAEAVARFGGDVQALRRPIRAEHDAPPIGYVEVHIEQGPALERAGMALGLVSAICGQSRMEIELVGEAGHAGTVPMDARRDALCAGAEVVLEVERAARATPGMVATVGSVAVLPGAPNVIPGRVKLSLDVRHQQDGVREQALVRLREALGEIAVARGVTLHFGEERRAPAVATDPALSDVLARALAQRGLPVMRLPSGAGHDAAQMAEIAPVAMLFVRCRGGISHSPSESVDEADVAAAVNVLDSFLSILAQERA